MCNSWGSCVKRDVICTDDFPFHYFSLGTVTFQIAPFLNYGFSKKLLLLKNNMTWTRPPPVNQTVLYNFQMPSEVLVND